MTTGDPAPKKAKISLDGINLNDGQHLSSNTYQIAHQWDNHDFTAGISANDNTYWGGCTSVPNHGGRATTDPYFRAATKCELTGHVITDEELDYNITGQSRVSFICSVCAARIWINTETELDVYEAENTVAAMLARPVLPGDLDDLADLQTTLKEHQERLAEALDLVAVTRRSLTLKLLAEP